jgi:hypothetical protein
MWPRSGFPSALASPTPSASPPVTCDGSAPAALVGPRTSGLWLRTSLEAIEPSDRRTNQVRWIVRFSVPSGAPGPAVLAVQARFSVAGQTSFQVLGYDLLEPTQRPLREDEPIYVAPCQAAVLAIRTAGPLVDGTFRHELLFERVGLPEGGAVSERFALDLACDNGTFSCSPVAAGATPVATATPVPGVLNPRIGIIFSGMPSVEQRLPPVVRREGETRTTAELAGSVFNVFTGTVSPDGRRAVYFAQPPGEPWGLYLLDGSRPSEQRRLATIPGEIPAGAPVWANDGSGVAFTVYDEESRHALTPKFSATRTLDLSSLKVTELARLSDGTSYGVIGWDASTSTIAAMTGSRDNANYVVFSPTGRRTTPFNGYTIYGAANGRDVVGVSCTPSYGCSLWTWILGNVEGRVEHKLGAGLSLGVIGFRPGSSDIGLLVGSLPPGPLNETIELWSPEAGRRVVYRAGEIFPSPVLFRADGSGVYIVLRTNNVVVLDLRTGLMTPLPLPSGAPDGFRHLAASIVLE